ncbi:MAG: Tim44 domain-containing protein [Alphaproteobacteria bacterium]|nr:Tim44 domain-containing protein [Alphaproteobacteria bacterium]MBL6938988.1 Tim44 domain-containing protein [Alphaproteobacteria bacterium]MBL7099580.1 Tim44 domain-containing protein [Alphaproteobacteria bacterium]
MDPQLIEIFVLALIAGVILFRLYTVLGRRTGHEAPPPDPRVPVNAPRDTAKDNVIALPTRAEQIADRPADPVARGLFDIKLADRDFDADHFVAGSRAAYEIIVTAFARGDRAALKPLLSSEVYAAFEQVIAGREQARQAVEFTFVGFKDTKIVHAALKNRAAEITVAIGAQFISVTHGADGQVVDGDTKSVRDVTDVWTFTRDVRARDPNWLLVATSGGMP